VFRFRGIQTGFDRNQHKEAFERFGWTNVSIEPLTTLDNGDKLIPV